MLLAMPFGSLWLPVVLSAAAVWIASAIVWMVLPHHKPEWKKLPDEAAVMAALAKSPPAPGQYVFPYCAEAKDYSSPDFKARVEKGPCGRVLVLPNAMPAMGPKLVGYFLWCFAISFVTAYVLRHALSPGAAAVEVARLAAATSGVVYALGIIPEAIWIGRAWSDAIKSVIDGCAYAAITTACFVLLWPAA